MATKYPIELPESQKRLIIMTSEPTDYKCPDCKKNVHFEKPPSEDYAHCTTVMIKWV